MSASIARVADTSPAAAAASARRQRVSRAAASPTTKNAAILGAGFPRSASTVSSRRPISCSRPFQARSSLS